jgi:hypothetical protein
MRAVSRNPWENPWDLNLGGQVAFGDLGCRDRPRLWDGQRFFINNLHCGLQAAGVHIDMYELDSVFKIDERWNTESVGRINVMISKLWPCPREWNYYRNCFKRQRITVFKYDLHRKKAIFIPHVRGLTESNPSWKSAWIGPYSTEIYQKCRF